MNSFTKTNTIHVRKGGMTLRTFSQLIGMPVYCHPGKNIGIISDFCFADDGHISGMIVHQRAFLKKSFFISLQKVMAFGSEGIIVSDGNCEQKPPKNSVRFVHDSVFGKMVLSDTGEALGLLHDVCFLEKMGTIIAYETTDGFFSELTEGKRLVRSEQPPSLGEDAIIVSVYE